jgi:lysine 2,3-aminomutase
MLDIPGGYGKVPIGPNYVEAMPGGYRVTDPNGGEHAFPDAE